MSAPARFIEVICSITTCFSSIQPLSAAALIILYSPLTLYATTGTLVVFLTSLMISKKLNAGLTIIISAPSCKSLSSSLNASLLLAGSIWYVFLDRKSTRLNSSHVSISYAVFCFVPLLLFLLSFPTRRSSDLTVFTTHIICDYRHIGCISYISDDI